VYRAQASIADAARTPVNVSGMAETLPEPWLRGTSKGIHPLHAALLHSFQQAAEDVERFTEGLTDEQMWARPFDLAPVGFQIRHITGSIDRLLTYAEGRQLSAQQMARLTSEMQRGASRGELLKHLSSELDQAATIVRRIDPNKASEERAVGRKQLPTTVGGLLVHIAEHTQRHVGQCVVTAKIVRLANTNNHL